MRGRGRDGYPVHALYLKAVSDPAPGSGEGPARKKRRVEEDEEEEGHEEEDGKDHTNLRHYLRLLSSDMHLSNPPPLPVVRTCLANLATASADPATVRRYVDIGHTGS